MRQERRAKERGRQKGTDNKRRQKGTVHVSSILGVLRIQTRRMNRQPIVGFGYLGIMRHQY